MHRPFRTRPTLRDRASTGARRAARRRSSQRHAAAVEPLESRQLLAAAQDAVPATHGVVIIDSTLAASIPQEELVGSLVVAIDSSRDVVDQITTALDGLADVSVLRVISHGSDGTLWFGGQSLDSATLAARATDVSGWSKSLTADADILLYGCLVASTDDGRLFVEQLGSLTQADIAASTDATGTGGDVDLEFQQGEVTAALLASAASYERAGVSLDVTTSNSSITNWTNNGNGTVTVTMKYDISGAFYVPGGGSSPNGYVYMYLNGTQVARQAVTIDTTFTEFGTSGLGSVTRGSKNLLFTATLTLPQLPYSKDSDRRWVGDNTISVSPLEGVPTTWADPDPRVLRIEAPYYYGFERNYTVAAGQTLYTVANVFGTPPITQTATGLPTGVTISSNGTILGAPVSGSAGVYPVVVRATNGFAVTEYSISITVTNQAPSFATMSPAVVSGATESSPFTITYAALAAALDDADPNGDPLSFRVESVLGGTLTKNGTPVTAGTTAIAPGESLVWTPPATVNGTRDAFTVRASDGALWSATVKTVQVAIGAVNDPPTLTLFSGPVATGNEDSAIPITFAALAAQGDEADIDSTVTAFVVKDVTTGTLRIGSSEATATAWNAATNKAITAGLNAYWTPALNANGPQSAFRAVARDDGGLESVTSVQAVVSVTPVADAPTLTAISIISGQPDGAPIEISYASLAAAGDEADVDGDAIAFRIESVTSGSLQKWNGSGWAAVVPGTTLVAFGDKLLWTPAVGSSGLQNAFTVKAWDGQFASATAIQVRVDAARWTVLPWTSEATSGLDPKYRYTHAYSFGAAGSFTLGGVAFTGVAGANPAVAGKLSTANFLAVGTNDANNLADASRTLANDFVSSYGGNQTVTLRGLIPGGRYVLSLFSVGAESGERLATFQGAMGQVAVNENQYGNNNGLRVDYKYLADASGSATITIVPPGNSFQLYGLANREHAPSIGLYAPASLTYDAAAKPFQSFTAAHNEPFVSAGVGHTVVLKSDGTVTAYGFNEYGQTNVPAGLNNVVAVSAGGYHTLALTSDGTVVSWGGLPGSVPVPAGLTNVVAISAGKVHSLALKSDGTVVAWGSNGSGQTGVPAGLTGIVAISAGSEHSLALKADGTVVAWGHGFYDYATPPAGLTDVVAISAGEYHSLALKADGTVTAWGNNGSFQTDVPAGLRGVVAISAGTTNSVAVKSDGTVVSWGDRDGYTLNSLPSNVPPGLTGVVAIDSGSSHTVALKSDGTVVTWGSNYFGQKFIPAGLNSLVAISTGRDHTLALKSDGTVLAWGGNTYGQTSVPAGLTNVVAVEAGDQLSVALKGDGTVVAWGGYSGSLPAGLTGVMKISASGDHVLALKGDGTVVAWGENRFGQITVPAALSSAATANVVAVAAGIDGSLALKRDGTVVYWGFPYNGQPDVPVGLSGVKAIAAGDDFFLALKTDGTVVAWGDTRYSYWNVPAGLTGVVAIEAGEYHALALKSDGSVVAWGSNLSGATNVPASTAGVGVVGLAAGYYNSIVLKSDGTIVLWGDNYGGKSSPPAATQFPAVGIFSQPYTFDNATTYSYSGRGTTVYAASATAPTNAGDYTVTATSTVAGNTATISQNFTINKVSAPVYFNNRVSSITYGTALSSLQLDSTGPYWWNNGSYTALTGTRTYSPAAGTVLPVGTHTLSVTFVPTDSVNFNPAVATSTVTVAKATVAAGSITLTPPPSLTYDAAPKAYTAAATNVGGFTYSYSGRAGTAYGPSAVAPTYAGSYTVTATVNDPNYQGSKSLDFAIAKAATTITTAPVAAAISYGQTLAAAALSGGVGSVAGAFAFAAPATAPAVGTASYTVAFTPADSINYLPASGSVSVTVNAVPLNSTSITLSPPASLVYSGSPKAFTASAPGFVTGFTYAYAGIGSTTYASSATAPTAAGTYAVTATVTSANYSGSATSTFEITKATPVITWATPAAITYGTTLSATQLNASASVAGATVYTPAASTLLDAGVRTLTAVFTPTDTANYTTATKSVPLQVNTTSLAAKKIELFAPGLTYDGMAKAYVVSQMPSLAAGGSHSLALKADGTVVAWGLNDTGQTNVPAGLTGVVQVAASAGYSVALKSDGKIVGWGSNTNQQYSGFPLNWDTYQYGDTLIFPRDLITNATAIAAGEQQTVVLRADGTVTVLGNIAITNAVTVPAGLTGVTAIASGQTYAVALKSDGTVVAWGDDDYGAATVPAGLSGVVAIAAGTNHTLALKADGTVVAWGKNWNGQSTVPDGLTGVVAITASRFGSFALKSDGTVVGWGIYQVGNAQIAGPGSGIVAIAAGDQHIVMLKSDGTVTATGANSNGQTTIPAAAAGSGYFAYSYSYAGRAGTTYAASASAPVNAGNYQLTVTSTDPNYTGSKTVDFTIAKATPAITTLPQAAIIAEGQPLSAALLDGGVTSVPGTIAFSTPSFVPPAGASTQEITFTPTDSVNYASVKRTITVLSQGTNAATPAILSLPAATPITFGQKLQASVLTGGSASVPGTFVYSSRLSVPNPGPASQSVTFIPTDIANYRAVTVAVPLTVYDGIVSPLNITLVPPASLAYDGQPKDFVGSKASFLSVGDYHALAVRPDGTVAAWGNNDQGQSTVPFGLSGVVAVKAGLNRSLALKADGTVVGWGQVVEGDNVPAGLANVVAISTGGYHNLALKSDGTVVAWGYNDFGQCNVPVGLANVVAVAATRGSSYALKSDGTVVTWGPGTVPAGLSGVVAIAAGSSHILALKADGTVVAWGDNRYGQCNVPAGLTGVVAVSAGHTHSVALKADGTVVAWGDVTAFSETTSNLNVVPTGMSGVVAIAAGMNQTFALKADGSVVFWGRGSESGPYKVNGEVYRTSNGFAVTVQYATTVADIQAGFPFSYSYSGRDGTTYAASGTAPTNPGDYRVTATSSDPDFLASKTIDFTIAKGTPSIFTLPAAAAISYGQTLASSALNGGSASVAGTFAFAAPATAPNAGSGLKSVVFTPGDTTKYLPVTFDVSVTVNKVTPTVVTLPTATTITYGQTLAAAVLGNGLGSVPGTFAFTAAATAPAAGTSSQGLTFTPADTTNYESFTASVNVLVERATPTITTPPTAVSIRFGQTLADSALSGGVAVDADGHVVPGTFAFADPTAVPDAGSSSVDVIFTPTDTANFTMASGTATIAVQSFAVADDTGTAGEAGGTANATAGFSAVGNVLGNDPVYGGSPLAVTAVSGSSGAGVVGTPLAGTYGSLTILSSGDYVYVVDDANAAVEALAPGATLVESFTVSVSNGTSTDSATLRITIFGANDAATMTSVGIAPLTTATEDTETTITFAMIQAAADEADIDGTVAIFMVREVTSGTLRIGTTPESATPWDAATNAVIDLTQHAYWTPDADATGPRAAFTVVARDNGGLDSATPLSIVVDVAPVNDAPVITPVSIAFTDTVTADVFSTATGTLAATDVDSVAFTFGITGVTPVADVFTLAGTYGTLTVNRLTGAYAFAPNDAAINAATGDASETFPIFVSDGAAAAPIGVGLLTITIAAADDLPTLTAFTAPLTEGTEDTVTEVLFADLLARGDAADADGRIVAFRVTAVQSGRLSIGTSAATATAWNATTNAEITSTLKGYWTPDADSNGPIDAFAVVVRDDGGNESTPAVVSSITIAPVNDAPSLTALSLAAGSTTEDTEAVLTFAAIAAAGDEADVDGTVTAFVVKAVSSGTLKIGGTAGTATPWNAATNAVISAGLNAYWTPAANASGLLDAFTVVARDDGGLESPVALPVQVSVSAVNDAPVITVPFAQTTDEDVAIVFSSGNGNLISIADFDAASSAVEVTLSVSHGVLTLSGITGLVFTTGDGTADAALAFSGTLASVNAALAGLTYTPDANYHGSDSLSIGTSDLGSTGSGGTLTDTDSVAITVSSVNDAPTDIALSAATVAENAPTDTTVGTLSTTDIDAGDSFTYTLVSGTGDTDNASFGIVGGSLKTCAAFNFEVKSSYTVRIRATDADGLSTEKAFTVTVTNVNEAPTDIALSTATVAENASSDTTVGTLSTTDVDAGDTFTYTLVSGTGDTDNASFRIAGGSLKTGAAFNFETKSSYRVRVRATDADGFFTEKAFTVTVTNVNEAPTDIALSTATVAENASSDTTVGTLSTTDVDAGDTFTYTLVSGTGDTDNASFRIAGGSLKTGAAFNFEAKSSYTVRVRTTDADGLFTEKNFTVTVTNVNETPSDIALSAATVAENAPSGTTIGTLSTTDVDAGDAFTCTLVSGTGDTDNASFAIVGGTLKTIAAFNFEVKSSYTVRVRATDADGLFTEEAFTVTVTNVNEAPTDIALSAATIAENAPSGTTIGTLSTTDVDAGDAFTYTLVSGTGDTDNASFVIDGSGLKTGAAFNFEAKSSYTVRVRATDADGLFTEKAFTVTVTNVNEAPTDIALSTATVAENASSGTTVGTLSTTDVDAVDTFTYTLVSGAGDTDNASFVIDGASLKTGAALNFEVKSSYSVRVRATDADGLFTEKAFSVTVTNVNETPTDIALSTATVAENAPSGTTVGMLSATDVDAGDTFTYALVSGTGDTDNASFTIDGASLKTGGAFNFEAKSSYTVRVRSTDADGLFTEKSFTITVTDVGEAAIISLPAPFANQVTEDTAVDGQGFLVTSGVFGVADQDAGESAFGTTVTAPDGQTNLGDLTVDAAGNYVYKVRNSLNAVQALRAGATQTDRFVIRSLDGTTRTVSFQITGVADTLVGAVADGYLANATLFADSNGNKVRDWIDAGGLNGIWDAGEGEAWTTTDANGDFSFDFGDPTATLITIGGTDLSTGLPFVGSLSAPAGSTIVNPLTTLVAATSEQGSLTAAQAAEAVRVALGLPVGVNLTTYDPLAQTPGDATALQVQKAAATVANLIVVATNNAIDSVAALANLAGFVNAGPATPIDLESPTVLASVLTVTVGSTTTPPPAAVVAGLALVNTTVNDAATIAAVAKSQEVAQNGSDFTAPAFTSAATAGFATGIAGSFQFAATGYPAPTFSTTGTLPTGVTLTPAGLLAGTPAPGTAGVYAFTVSAANGIAPAATQGFTLTVGQTDDVSVSVVADRILLSLAPTGVVISSLHTAYNAKTRVLTITAIQPGTMVVAGAGTPGVTVNPAAKTIAVNLDVLPGFAGFSIIGNSGVDAVTIDGDGIDLAAVTRGAANQSFSIDTKAGATDTVVVGKPIRAKGAGSVSLATLGVGPTRGIQLGGVVTTPAGSQTYAGAVTLVSNASLTAGGGIGFAGTVDGAKALWLSAGGAVTFAGAVGGTTPLRGVTLAQATDVTVNGAFRLNGAGTFPGTSGLTIAANVNNVVFATVDPGISPRTITGFTGSGIRFLGSSQGSSLRGIVSTGNGTGLGMAAGTYTGTVISACDFSDNAYIGVSLTDVRGLALGMPSAGNTISRNGIWGVYASGSLTGTTVQNNTLDGNARAGVRLVLATGLLVGGTSANTGNRIINARAWRALSMGIHASGNSSGTAVQGNTISGNAGHGVLLEAARGITIGGAGPSAGNTIRDNLGFGLLASGDSRGALVQGNTFAGNGKGAVNVRAAPGLRLS